MLRDQGKVVDNLPPQDLEAEAAVLGACILDSSAVPYVVSKLTVKSFWSRRHQAVFQAIKESHEKNEPIDEITLRAKVEPEYRDLLFDLIRDVPSAAKATSYVAAVRKYALARDAISALTNGLHDIEEAGLPDDVVAQTIEALEKARSGTSDKEPVSIGDILMRPGALVGDVREFKMVAIQDATHGVAPGGVVLIAGKEGAGKTTLLMQLMVDVAKGGDRVHIWSKDQTPADLSKIAWAGMEGTTIEDVIANAATTFERIDALPIYFDESELTVDNILNSMRIQAAQGVRWFLLDYLGLVETPGHNFSSDWQRSVHVAKRLKNLALDTKSYMFIIQEVIKPPESHPKIEHIAGGRSLFHAAHQVWFLDAPELVKGEEEDITKPTDFYVFKNRHGRKNRVQLDFQGAFHRFRSWRGV